MSCKHLQCKATAHATIITRSPLDHHETGTCYRSILMPSIQYPLLSLSLTPQDCHNIEKIYKPSILQKSGYNKNLSNAIIYGSKSYSRLGLHNLYTEQGISQLQALLLSLQSEGPQHTLSLIAISWAQLLASMGFPILNDVQTLIPHLYPMKWMPSIRQYMPCNNSHVTLEQTFVTPLQCECDIHIMDLVLQHTDHPTTLKIFNTCRMYLQVILLSDIVTANRCNILPGIVQGQAPATSKPTTMFPYQPKPNVTSW